MWQGKQSLKLMASGRGLPIAQIPSTYLCTLDRRRGFRTVSELLEGHWLDPPGMNVNSLRSARTTRHDWAAEPLLQPDGPESLCDEGEDRVSAPKPRKAVTSFAVFWFKMFEPERQESLDF